MEGQGFVELGLGYLEVVVYEVLEERVVLVLEEIEAILEVLRVLLTQDWLKLLKLRHLAIVLLDHIAIC